MATEISNISGDGFNKGKTFYFGLVDEIANADQGYKALERIFKIKVVSKTAQALKIIRGENPVLSARHKIENKLIADIEAALSGVENSVSSNVAAYVQTRQKEIDAENPTAPTAKDELLAVLEAEKDFFKYLESHQR